VQTGFLIKKEEISVGFMGGSQQLGAGLGGSLFGKKEEKGEEKPESKQQPPMFSGSLFGSTSNTPNTGLFASKKT
jgi:hypothetical protein